MPKRQLAEDTVVEREVLKRLDKVKSKGAALTRYACGHVGRDNDAPTAKAKAWIRVAEVRNRLVEDDPKKCGDCK